MILDRKIWSVVAGPLQICPRSHPLKPPEVATGVATGTDFSVFYDMNVMDIPFPTPHPRHKEKKKKKEKKKMSTAEPPWKSPAISVFALDGCCHIHDCKKKVNIRPQTHRGNQTV